MAQLYLDFDPPDQTPSAPAPSGPPPVPQLPSSNDPSGKFCNCCGQVKPRTAFYACRSRKDGLQAKCRACDRGKVPSKRPKSPNVGRPIDSPTKVCTRCLRDIPRSEFEKRSRSKDGLQAWCRACNREVVRAHIQKDLAANAAWHREWRKKNPGKAAAGGRKHYRANRESSIARVILWRKLNAEHVRAYYRRWLKESGKGREYCRRYEARKRSNLVIPFSLDDLKTKVAFWGNRCWMCGGQFEAVDHVKPVTKGGPHCLANLRPACKGCNSKKRNKWPFPTAPAPVSRPRLP